MDGSERAGRRTTTSYGTSTDGEPCVDALINPTNLVSTFGYAAIFLLSVAQSCCVPTSSELTLGFAGALSATGQLNLGGAIAAGAGGELVGAYLAWVIGRTAGRLVVDRYGKYLLLTHHDLDRAEAWYQRHGRWGVFGGRLLPVIRNFVALPAGVAEVPLVRFGVLTALGSLIWDGAMAGIGYGVGSRWHEIVRAFSDAGYVLGALAVVGIVYVIVHRWRSYGAHLGKSNYRAPSGTGGAGVVPSTSGVTADGIGMPAASSGRVGMETGSGGLAVADTAQAAPQAGAAGALGTWERAPGQDPGLANPREEILALVRTLAAPGEGVGERTGAAANERLTAIAGAALFVLIFLEGVTLLKIHSLLAAHVIIGLVLIPPVLVKLASTSWRFLRYYTGHPDYVRKGPPRPLLRVLAPFLVVTTVVLFGSGIGLVVMEHPYGWLYVVHRFDFVAWFVILAVHVLTYLWQVPGVVRRDVSRQDRYRRTSPWGRALRLWLVGASVVAGVALTVLVWPSISHDVHHFHFVLRQLHGLPGGFRAV